MKLIPTASVLCLLACCVLGGSHANGGYLENYEAALLPSADGNNKVRSPLGVWSATGALALGAQENTLQEIAGTFNLPVATRPELLTHLQETTAKLSLHSEAVGLRSHLYLLVNKEFPLQPQYKEDLKNVINATVLSLDFKNSAESARLANDEVRKHHTDFRPFGPDDFHGDLLATNVISFEGKWRSPFAPYATSKQPFFDESGTLLGDVNMMTQKKKLPLVFDDLLSAQVLELEYDATDDYSMLLLLPSVEEQPFLVSSVKKILRRLPELNVDNLLRRLRNSTGNVTPGVSTTVLVSLPRFVTKSSLRLEGLLQRAGVADLFTASADLGLISEVPLHVSRVSQQALVEVTEGGSKAQDDNKEDVANAVRDGAPDPPRPTKERKFTADHPFVYLIYAKNIKKVLFYGVYGQPTLF